MFLGTFLLLSLLIPSSFLSKYNLQSMMFQLPEFGILALGMMVAILTGGIDLSIIANANLSGIIAAITMHSYLNSVEDPNSLVVMLIIIVTAALSGLLFGVFNGILITRFRIPAILATLGTMKLFDGISTVLTNGQPIRNFPPVVATLSNNTILGIPYSFLIFILVFLGILLILEKTKLGFTIYMYGENPKATRYSGLSNNAILLKAFMISGLLAGIAGLVMMSRFNSIKVGYGNSYLLQTVLVAVLGGVNPEGGKGKTLNVVLGILTLQVISSGFNIMGFTNYIRNVIYGSVLIIVMVIHFVAPKAKRAYQNYKKRKALDASMTTS
jgi:simple sugar transport system permease protein